jgi:hypothetical protein
MNLDLLDENYPMVVSKLPFEQLSQAGLTRLSYRSNRSQTCQIRVSTYTSYFLVKLAYQEICIQHQNCIGTMLSTRIENKFYFLRTTESIAILLEFAKYEEYNLLLLFMNIV